MIRLTIPSSGYDVVVVGARCAGAATAMLLARAGHRVLMVDRGRYGTDTLSTHALMRGAVIQLHRWNILPAVIAADTTPVRQATFFYGDESVSIPVAPRDGIEALYAPRRYVLDRLLVDAAGAAGADIVYGVRIKDLQRAETGRVIGVVLEDESGDVHRVASRVVVGADGLRSTVARLVGAQTYRVGQHASGTMYGHWSGLEVDGYGWYFVRGLSAAAIPTNAGQVCVSVSVPGQEFTRLFAHQPDSAFRELLSQVAPDLAGQDSPLERRPGSPSSRIPRSPRVLSARPRTRLGTGRRRRILQGPANRSWHHGCAARRGAAGQCDRRRIRRARWLTTRNSAMRRVWICSKPPMRLRRSTGT